MSAETESLPKPALPLRGFLWAALVATVAALCIPVAVKWILPTTVTPIETPEADPPALTVGGLKLFADWPKDQAPEAVLLLSGQTYGYLSPCGCSQPQKGGLERRYNLVAQMKSRGGPVIGLDLGDVAPPKGIHQQNLLKYRTAMAALNEMGYAAIGLGEYDFSTQLFDLLSSYTLNNPNKPPFVLAGNLLGVARDNTGKVTKAFTREEFFPGGDAKDRPMIDSHEVIVRPNLPAVGVVGVIGSNTADRIVALDKQFDFARDEKGIARSAPVIKAALAKIAAHPAKPELRVLLYVGKLEEAREAAKAFPEFQIILCQSDDSEPPNFPVATDDGKTQIVQVGHKGQSVGVMGVFRTAAGFSLKYQLVTLTEEFLTPEGDEAEKNHPVLKLLEGYTKTVKEQNLLALYAAKQTQHASHVAHPAANLRYIGAEACAKCHAAEYAVWSKSKHSHAYEALEKYAKRPSNRQFDGECLVCHTTGMEFQTGFTDLTKTPNLKNNGCENCHGPGSGHAANPNDKALLASLSKQWKTKPTDRLPSPETMLAIAKLPKQDRGKIKLTADQTAVIDNVYSLCTKCHDTENDPKFDIYEYMPKVYHSNLKTAGLPAGAK